MKVIKAPESQEPAKEHFSVFLAGSIEQGKAVKWQDKITEMLKDLDVVILNPRRSDWDDSWDEDIENKQFREQVEWELDGQDLATLIIMYFDPATKSPITLLELGLYAHSGKMIVCCPEGFWRKGNVDIVCKRYDVMQVDSIEVIAQGIKKAYELSK